MELLKKLSYWHDKVLKVEVMMTMYGTGTSLSYSVFCCLIRKYSSEENSPS